MSRINVMKTVKVNTNVGKVETVVRDYGTNYKPNNGKFEEVYSVAEMMQYVFNLHRENKEHLFMLGFNDKDKCSFVLKLASGNENECSINAFKTINTARELGAKKIILIHNHPSGNATLSDADIKMTKEFDKICSVAGIKLDDHIVLGSNDSSYASFKELDLNEVNDSNNVIEITQHKKTRHRRTKAEANEIRLVVADNVDLSVNDICKKLLDNGFTNLTYQNVYNMKKRIQG